MALLQLSYELIQHQDLLHLSKTNFSINIVRRTGTCKKHPNKNPVAVKAVQELEGEIAHQQTQGGAITHVTLAVALQYSIPPCAVGACLHANRCQCPITS